jgi:hypothetical protein
MQGNRVKLGKKYWCKHVPKSIETSQGAKVTKLWNQEVQTDRTIPNNKPDIIICDNEKRTYLLTPWSRVLPEKLTS